MKKRILLLAAAVIIVASALLGWRYFCNHANHAGKIFVSGNIEATEVDLSFRLAGQIKTLPIEEGDRVQRNQVIATLDSDPLIAQKGIAEAEIANARAVLDEMESGFRKEQIEAARALHKAAESKFLNARDEFNRYEALIKEGAISASQFDARATAFKVAKEEFENAGQRFLELETGQREEKVRAARATLDRAGWQVKRIQLDIEYSNLITPVTGVILVKANEQGEVVLPGATVATVAAIDEVWLKGYVGEVDLGKVKLGQQAEITTDSYPGKVYRGKVTFVSPRSEFTPKNVQTKEERVKQVFRVKITIPNLDQELKIGMPAEGWILVNGEPQAGRGERERGEKPK